MFDEINDLNIKSYSDSELIALIRQAFPLIKEFFNRFCLTPSYSCQDCPEKERCQELNKNKYDKRCLILEPLLPGKYQGKGYREKNSGLMIKQYQVDELYYSENTDVSGSSSKINRNNLNSVRRIKMDEQFMLYKNCPPGTFTLQQWEAVYLRFEHGLTQQKIANIIGVKRSAISDRLRRAKKNMKNYYKRKISQ